MQQLLARALGEVVNAAPGDTILEVGVDTTKGKLLTSIAACLLEGVV